MKQLSKIRSFLIAILGLVLLVGIGHTFAWTNPTSNPPYSTNTINISAGNVGIGKSNPAYKLDVVGDMNFTGTLRQNGTPFSTGGQWATNGVNIYNTNTGNVGIGTATPGGGLDINHVGGQLKLSGGTVAGGVWTATDMMYLANWIAPANGLSINMTSGNVGIGTVSPAVPLHLQRTASGNYFTLENTDGTSPAAYSEMRLLAGTRSGYLWVRNQNGASGEGDGAFNVYAETGDLNLWAGAARVVNVNKNGNVGIGMTAPAYKLDIVGPAWNSIARVYSTTGSGGIDFWDSGVRRGVVYSGGGGGFGLLSDTASWALRIPSGTVNIMGYGDITPNGQSTYGLRGNDTYADTINTGVAGDPLELNYRVAGDIRFTGGDQTMALGRYVYPGSNSGLVDYQKSYYLASNAGYGLYTNTSFYTAGGLYPQGYGVQGPATTYGTLSLITPKNGYYGLLFGQDTTKPNLMFDGSGNGGIYYENYGWTMYTLAGSHNVGIGTTAPAYKLDVAGSVGASNIYLSSSGTWLNNGSMTSPGYTVLPSGLKMEWGVSSGTHITLPSAYSLGVWNVQVTSTGNARYCDAYNVSTTGFDVICYFHDFNPGWQTYYWFAIGM